MLTANVEIEELSICCNACRCLCCVTVVFVKQKLKFSDGDWCKAAFATIAAASLAGSKEMLAASVGTCWTLFGTTSWGLVFTSYSRLVYCFQGFSSQPIAITIPVLSSVCVCVRGIIVQDSVALKLRSETHLPIVQLVQLL